MAASLEPPDTLDAGNRGRTDREQLEFAVREVRCRFTFNRSDFANPELPIGTVIELLARLLSIKTAHELRDQLVWLSLWRSLQI